jgi:hypothetical protein
VESLFTNISQQKLLTIINSLLIEQNMNEYDRSYFIKYLNIIVTCNTFQVNDHFYLQKKGLPMGGVLSGCLANIYLGILEKDICHNGKIILYNRYMDDILIISTFNEVQFSHFVTLLKTTFQLTITSSSNKHLVNFLDMNIAFSPSTQRFVTFPFSKKFLLYPIPSTTDQRSFQMDKNIVLSQILRTWRLSNSNKEFSRGINIFLQHLLTLSSPYFKKIRNCIFTFLLPIKKSTHLWETNIPVCSTCQSYLQTMNISITKCIIVDQKYISIKEPLNCLSKSIYVILHKEGIFNLLHIPSIHYILHYKKDYLLNGIILPLGNLNSTRLQCFLKKHPTINYWFRQEILAGKRCHPCPIYTIFKNPKNIYGIPFIRKKRKTVNSFFNKFKFISRNPMNKK